MSDEILNGSAADSEQKVSFPPAQFNFVIATDKMAAYLRVTVFHADQRVTEEEIRQAVAKQGIVYGIDDGEIDAFIKGGNMRRELRVASGDRPVKGENGSVEFHFDFSDRGRPKEREDGTVDFKNLEIVKNVSKGDVLCTVHLPKEGTDGKDIFGQTVKAPKGDMPAVPGGDKTVLSEDGTKVLAAAEGNLLFKGNKISIEDVFTVGDVGIETGNIDFNGSVVINGLVHEGFSVKAISDITVKGMVEGAKLEAGGNILIKLGINGMGKADIFAAGDITSGFIENASVKCGGSLYADTVLNSRIMAGENVVLKGKRGALLGGSCVAGSFISAKTIGSDKNIQQEVTVAPRWYEYEKRGLDDGSEADPWMRMEQLADKRAQLSERAAKVSAEIARLQRPQREFEKPLEADEKNAKMRGLIMEKSKFTVAIAALDKETEDLKSMFSGFDFKVVCLGGCFPGARIQIGRLVYRVSTLIQNQVFRADGGEVALNQVMPHERG